ncbi:TIGR04283 family arsenosugar biosynthesis glycosyltransferase [Laspinema olomoucense]|uniref:TIGR04283 family arsenosugar biosynthesis glycosyltransferase n=1 Tax=Laspinema olomoucense TaxID=3231600 RepID=UPI00295006C2|nr:TIGR04283 family arsenosugar biosynthesis glycosyltransferase [Laspinema sp. D3a]
MLDHPNPDRLIIFTRLPYPGTTKTRLIPALGAGGAALLHRQLGEHTLATVRDGLQQKMPKPIAVEVRFTGGTLEQMQGWLGEDLEYRPQSEGDLGDRLIVATQEAFEAGCSRLVLIGTDCPDLDARILRQAFDSLHSHDLVLGPAMDGGYYLIGLSRFVPELFQGIAWGTGEVLAQTLAVASSESLTVAKLPELRDIDRPEDLAFLGSRFSLRANPGQISIILPVLNEEAGIGSTLAGVCGLADVEIILVDGGSSDRTREIATSYGVSVVRSEPGRGRQMNLGAAQATGEILLFLHGDTRLGSGFDREIRRILEEPKVVGGAFELRIEGPEPLLRVIEWGVKWRSRLGQMPYGDQGIFVRAATFWELRGFAEMGIMEDFEFVGRLKRRGRLAIAPLPAFTSARRWQKWGILRTTGLNQLMIVGYYLGISPARLAHWYRSATLK